jgi:hypothetical protein
LKIRGLPAQPGAVVDDFAIYLARCVIDESHDFCGGFSFGRRDCQSLRQ